jgi:molybdate transport system substrate-binding protein
MLMKKIAAIVLFFAITGALFFNAPAVAAEQKSILVSAAVSLKNVLEQCQKRFEEKNPDVKIKFNFGGSGMLLNQIKSGAPIDLFFSADIRDFDKIDAPDTASAASEKPAKIIAEGYPKPFAGNELVFIVPKSSEAGPLAFEDLRMDALKKIAIGNPKTVPAGRYADEAIRASGRYEALREKLVLCENVRQVLDYVIRGEVDGGFVYRTDAAQAAVGEIRLAFAVSPEMHAPIVYGLGRLTAANNPELVERFIAFMAGPECREILTAAGFLLPKQ